MGLGALGLATLLDSGARAAPGATGNPLSPRAPHFPGKARAVIQIFAQGAPSHLDTWDPKPALTRFDGRSIGKDGGVAMGSPFAFQRYGKSGIEVSELFAKTAAHVDDMAVIRSMYTDIPAHDVATVFMNTGSLRITKPSLGSWTVYGLGTENQNLPGFISLRGNRLPAGGANSYGAAFLPGLYQGTSINTTAATVQQMIQHIRNGYASKAEQRRQLDLVHSLNELHAANLAREDALEARLETYEIAFRMQAEATDAFDLSREAADTRAAYGETAQGRQMLLARRLVERGVRFVQVYSGGNHNDHNWDAHGDLVHNHEKHAGDTDQPVAALLTDLKQRGLLDSTIVVWGGEFGRQPTAEYAEGTGRDHDSAGFTMWLAGGGIKGGIKVGATDELGYKAVEKPFHVKHLHATILQQMGLDPNRLAFFHAGLDQRLVGTEGAQPIRELIA
jgi:hypothetical protein